MTGAAARLTLLAAAPEASAEPAFHRLWRRFMAGRVFIAAVLLGLLAAVRMGLGGPVSPSALLIALAYLLSTVYAAVRVQPVQPGQPGRAFDPHWAVTVGMDLLVFSVLQFQHVGTLTFWPLFGLPVLTAAVLGSASMAMATAAAASLLLIADAWLVLLEPGGDAAPRFVQAGLTGSAYFVVALLANQLAGRVARLEETARRNRDEALAQATVNARVMETLADGVLVFDGHGHLQAANPAARAWIGGDTRAAVVAPEASGLSPLRAFALHCVTLAREESTELDIENAEGPLRVQVRARLVATSGQARPTPALCVLFVQDLRELQARLRTERLAAMGQVSAAVAHEIRNPLAAIAQANALLAEELDQPGQRQLSELVRHNAQRLARVVEDVLDVGLGARVSASQALLLDASTDAILAEWIASTGEAGRVHWRPGCDAVEVGFDAEHLRRLLVNLLDNARRFASPGDDAIQVFTEMDGSTPALGVWSDGAPLDPSVQGHLFEPFFSSDPRSSGLGLFICRELCQRHGADIAHRRAIREVRGRRQEGNEFRVRLRLARSLADPSSFDTMAA